MVRGSKIKGMVMLLLFLGTAVVYAAPTMNDSVEGTVVFDEDKGSYAYPCHRPERVNNTGLYKSHFASISEEFNKPPVRYGHLMAPAIGIKELPAAPGTLLMVLVGFLCVSVVRDRGFWLTILTSMLWAGQSGISLFPQLALSVSDRALRDKQSSFHYITCLYEPREANRLRSDVEGTSYAGLLRHLAGIPHGDTTSMSHITERRTLKQVSGRLSQSYFCQTCCSAASVQSFYSQETLRHAIYRNTFRYHKKAFHFAITAITLYLNYAIDVLTQGIEQLNLFNTAFINASLARGPPDLT